jgi:hypothetical protein
MAQRISGYARVARDEYPTPAAAVRPLVPILRPLVANLWEPAPTEGGQSGIASLRALGFQVIVTTDDFLKRTAPPHDCVQAIVTNPPFGIQGRTAVEFIERALWLAPVLVAMLLKIDFDSGRTRRHLFEQCPSFAGKVVLLDRIVWFPRTDGRREAPSENFSCTSGLRSIAARRPSAMRGHCHDHAQHP